MFANPFKSSTFILFLVFKFVGLVPFSYVRNKNGQFCTTRYSPIGACYNLILIVLVIVLDIDFANNVSQYDMMNITWLYSASISIHAVTSIIGSCVILLTFCLRQKKFVTILNAIAKVDHQLAIKQENKFQWTLTLYSILVLLLILYNYIVQGEKMVSRHFFAMFGGYMIICFSIMQYAIVLQMFRDRFRTVNRKLRDVSRKIEFKTFSYLCNNVTVPLISSDLTLQKLREVHEELIGAAENVNEFYGFCMLVNTGTILYNFASNTYFLYVLSPKIWSENFILTVLYSLYKIIPLWILATFAGQTLKEVKRTGRIVHKLIMSTNNQKYLGQLKEFSSYVLHIDLKFTAHEFFSLDETLLHSIFSAVTTYVVIFIQFDNGEGNAKETSNVNKARVDRSYN